MRLLMNLGGELIGEVVELMALSLALLPLTPNFQPLFSPGFSVATSLLISMDVSVVVNITRNVTICSSRGHCKLDWLGHCGLRDVSSSWYTHRSMTPTILKYSRSYRNEGA